MDKGQGSIAPCSGTGTRSSAAAQVSRIGGRAGGSICASRLSCVSFLALIFVLVGPDTKEEGLRASGGLDLRKQIELRVLFSLDLCVASPDSEEAWLEGYRLELVFVIARPDFKHRAENARAAGAPEMLRGLIEGEHTLLCRRHEMRKHLRAKLRKGRRRTGEGGGKDAVGW